MALWVAEYGKIYKSQVDQKAERGDLYLTEQNFNSVLSLLDENQERDLSPILKYSISNGQGVLSLQQYVGVICTESGCQIEILPKISKETNAEQAREMLIKMLVELRDSPFKEGVLSNLDAHKMPLFELLLRQFLSHVGDLVRKGIARTYVDQQENLVYLRGKLQLAEHIRMNSSDKSRLYCEFDEFEIDRPINRLIKGALETAAKTTQNADNQQLCRELLFWFDRVQATRDVARDFRSMRHDRLVQHYQPAMPLCRLILEGLNPLTKQGENRALSMLFPMSRLFEDYVAAKLRSQLMGWSVRSQVSRYSIVARHLGSPIFRLEPDLEFTRGTQRLIGDTKWKLIDQSNRGNNYGISQQDVYQLFAYGKKYLAGQANKQVMLIYPRTEKFDRPLEPFWFDEESEVLYVFPFDLERDELITDSDLFSIGHRTQEPSTVAA